MVSHANIRNWVVLPLVAVALSAGTLVTSREEALPPPADSIGSLDAQYSGSIELTDAELQAWSDMTESPESRAELLGALESSFDGVADFDAPAEGALGLPLGGEEMALAYGKNSTHFWITASYADMARGAIGAAVVACKKKVPAAASVCGTVGSVLSKWAKGWGSAGNHGVWAAVYWGPPRYKGGRW